VLRLNNFKVILVIVKIATQFLKTTLVRQSYVPANVARARPYVLYGFLAIPKPTPAGSRIQFIVNVFFGKPFDADDYTLAVTNNPSYLKNAACDIHGFFTIALKQAYDEIKWPNQQKR